MLGDTILALASPDGGGDRAVVRISGPAARALAGLAFAGELPDRRATVEGHLRVRSRLVPAMALVMPGPRSFTGEDVVELHLPGSSQLVTVLQEELLQAGSELGVRAAQPGEFTARACTNGRLDLAQAEGILMLLHAADRRELAASVQWLRGGMSEAMGQLRQRLEDVLALLESGLDFAADETGAVLPADVLPALAGIEERAAALLGTLPAVAPGGEVLLRGRANAGKSALANALAGRQDVLVAAVPGTTRDLVRIELGDEVALWDAPGDLDRAGADAATVDRAPVDPATVDRAPVDPATVDRAALALRDRLAGRAPVALAVLDATNPRWPNAAAPAAGAMTWLAVVVTKVDQPHDLAAVERAIPAVAGELPRIFTSAVARTGLGELRALLLRAAGAGASAAGGPLRQQLGGVLASARRAAAALTDGPELAAMELQGALRVLRADASGHSAEPLLDRIYGRFCLGK
ncbi:MAG: 50S ribosome-binding GTPase [bacterium]|nr:50S ribosome-binding GTPase [bacterium]